MINVSEKAIAKIITNLNKRGHGQGIKIGVKTTGCSGLAYILEYVDKHNEEDTVIEINNVFFYISPKHAVYLNGLTIDYSKQGINEGFEFINPNEKARCGCGMSFSI